MRPNPRPSSGRSLPPSPRQVPISRPTPPSLPSRRGPFGNLPTRPTGGRPVSNVPTNTPGRHDPARRPPPRPHPVRPQEPTRSPIPIPFGPDAIPPDLPTGTSPTGTTGTTENGTTTSVPLPNPPLPPNPTPEPGVGEIPEFVPSPDGGLIPTQSPGGFFIPGVPTTITTTRFGTATRTGTSTRINTTINNKSIGSKLVSLDVLPFMRSRNIEFVAKKLKPNTLLYPFFDGQSVYDYVVPKILEIEMVSGTFIAGETVSGTFIQSENVNIKSTATSTSIQFRLAAYNHKYGPYDNPTEVYSSSPYNIEQRLQPYSPSSTLLNVDTTSLSDLSLGNYGGNVFVGMILVGNQSKATARVTQIRLVSDNIGTLIGSLFIPNPNIAGNPRFSTGNKTFRLTDNQNNGTIAGTVYTFASANFLSDGLITQAQETILSVRNAEIQTGYLNETTSISNTTITTVPGSPLFVANFPPPPAPLPPLPPVPPPPAPRPPGPQPPTPQPPTPQPPGPQPPTPQPPTPQPPAPRPPEPRPPAPRPPVPRPRFPRRPPGPIPWPPRIPGVGGWKDPLAQTFRIGNDENPTGRYVTSVDLFFYSKSSELPVYVELRPVELGTPSIKIYPLSKVEILPENVNISNDGTVATRVKFPGPVYLEGNKEHALVLLSDSNDYSVFISRLGEVDITTVSLPESQQRLVSTQPTLGSLFKSQNASTWSPSQYEDLKFNLYTALFDPTGSVSFFNPELNRSNDQIAVLRNNGLDVESRRVRVGLGTTLSLSTINDLTEGSFIVQRETNAIGDFAYVTGIATGSLSIPNSGIGYTPSIGIQTYSNVSLSSITGFGRGATANITVTDGSITSAGISSGGIGYQVGDILTTDEIGITSIGRNLRLSVRELSAFNELVVDNVQGEFEVGVAKSVQYFSSLPGIGYTDLNGGSVFAQEVFVERDGLHINVKHRNHGMHSKTNSVNISNISSDIAPIKLANDIESDFTGNLVITGITTNFNTFENAGISSTNPGYLLINSEIISYTGVNQNSFTGITRGIDSTLQIRHPANSFVYKYELAGISLRRINKTHRLQDVTDIKKKNTLDSYYIKIDTSLNGVDRSVGTELPKLYLNSTKSTGGESIESTQNIQYDIAQPIVQTFTPPQTTITASLRTISGTSISGSEESFLDRGTVPIKLNQDNYFDNPRIIASRVNERLFLNNLIQGNKSLQMTLQLSTINPYLTPVIDLDRVGMILVSNRVNSPVLDYSADERVSLIDTDPNAFVYATKPIELEVPATSIKIIVSAHINIFNDLRAMFAIMKDMNETPIYYPFPGNGNISGNGRTLNISNNDGRPDLPLKVTSSLGFQSDELIFNDYEFTINNLESFKYFSVKLIGSSTSQTYPPRLRDLRIIALA